MPRGIVAFVILVVLLTGAFFLITQSRTLNEANVSLTAAANTFVAQFALENANLTDVAVTIEGIGTQNARARATEVQSARDAVATAHANQITGLQTQSFQTLLPVLMTGTRAASTQGALQTQVAELQSAAANTPTPSATLTPSLTPTTTPSPTRAVTLTATMAPTVSAVTPTATPSAAPVRATPTATAETTPETSAQTAGVLCRVTVQAADAAARVRPVASGRVLTTLAEGVRLDVFDVARQGDAVFYQVSAMVDGQAARAWVSADDVDVITPCPAS